MFQLSLGYFSFTLTPAPAGQKGPEDLLFAVPAFPRSLALGLFEGDAEGEKKKSNQNCRHGHKEASF